MNILSTPLPTPGFALNTVLSALTRDVHDPRVLAALSLCQDRIQEPPLGLDQIASAISVWRPRGKPSHRTIQRWIENRGMPWSIDTSSNQKVYFLSEVLTWYQQTFPFRQPQHEVNERGRGLILRQALNGRNRLSKAG